MSRRNRIRYDQDHTGVWWKTSWPDQCEVKDVWFNYECQGVLGHDGPHWAYDERGSLLRNLPDGSSECTPPDHKNYIAPREMSKLIPQPTPWEQVTDEALIARLNADDVEDNWSVSRPVSEDELSDEAKKNLEKYRNEH